MLLLNLFSLLSNGSISDYMAPKSVFIIKMSKDFVLEVFLLKGYSNFAKLEVVHFPRTDNSSSFVKGCVFFFIIILILFCGML